MPRWSQKLWYTLRKIFDEKDLWNDNLHAFANLKKMKINKICCNENWQVLYSLKQMDQIFVR